MDQFEEIVQKPVDPPDLTDEQSHMVYLIAVPKFGQFETEEYTGEELKAFAIVSEGTMPDKVRYAIFRFLPKAQPGEHLWSGHMQPLIFCTNKNQKAPLVVPKKLRQTPGG